MALLTQSLGGLTVRPCLWMVLAGLMLVGAPTTLAQGATEREYQVKAVFLFNFAQFVEWPPEAFAEPQAPLVIGILGTDPFGQSLDDVVRDEMIGLHPLLVRRYSQAEEIDACHILFISESETKQLTTILARLKGRHILTVSDANGFAKRGVMIRFYGDRNRIRLRINLAAAQAARLTISSKLLRPAEIVANMEN